MRYQAQPGEPMASPCLSRCVGSAGGVRAAAGAETSRLEDPLDLGLAAWVSQCRPGDQPEAAGGAGPDQAAVEVEQ